MWKLCWKSAFPTPVSTPDRDSRHAFIEVVWEMGRKFKRWTWQKNKIPSCKSILGSRWCVHAWSLGIPTKNGLCICQESMLLKSKQWGCILKSLGKQRQSERERPEALHATVTSNWARTGSSVVLKLLNTPLKKQAVDPRQVFSYTRVQEGENVTILSFLGLINLLDVTSCDAVFHQFHPCHEDTL